MGPDRSAKSSFLLHEGRSGEKRFIIIASALRGWPGRSAGIPGAHARRSANIRYGYRPCRIFPIAGFSGKPATQKHDSWRTAPLRTELVLQRPFPEYTPIQPTRDRLFPPAFTHNPIELRYAMTNKAALSAVGKEINLQRQPRPCQRTGCPSPTGRFCGPPQKRRLWRLPGNRIRWLSHQIRIMETG